MEKKLSFIFLLIVAFSVHTKAQDPVFIPLNDSVRVNDSIRISENARRDLFLRNDSLYLAQRDSVPEADMYGWKIDARSGNRTFFPIDETLTDFHQQSLVDGQGIAVSYLGNLGSPAQSKLFFERGEKSLFPFLDPFQYYHKTAKDHIFINTKTPVSNIYYQSGGGRTNKEERFSAHLTSNFGKKLNIGANVDYIYSRGYYQYLSNKLVSYNFYGSYVSDRYQLHAFVTNNYYNNSENGGIEDDRYITNPNALQFNAGASEIPPKLGQLWNRLKGREIFVSNRYNLGYETEIDEESGEEGGEFIPVASFILTTKYSDQQRRFGSRDEDPLRGVYTRTDSILGYSRELGRYDINYQTDISNSPANDQMAYWSLKNTFAVSLNEGFKEWVKFGLTAFVEQDFRKFSMPLIIRRDETSTGILKPLIGEEKSQNSTVIGGMLTKERGRVLKYNLSADFAVLGSEIGEFRLNGDISTTFRFAGKDAVIRAKGYIKNLKPRLFENNLRTKYTLWSEDLSDTRRLFAGGEVIVPHINLKLSGGVENIENHIYYNSNSHIAQANKNIQIVSLQAEHKLKAGIFHWDNKIAYQTTSDKDVIPLPQLSVYSNIYLRTLLAKVLTFQLGVDAHFNTEYYAQGYNPSLLGFHNQQDVKVGGFPLATAYANLHLKNTRFFVMMYNIGQDLGDSKYFSIPHYPLNPMFLKIGISWNFYN